MRNTLFAFSAATVVAASSCQCELEPLISPKGDLEGIACDFDTGAPLANEQVIWRPASGEETKVFADDTGYFSAKGVDAGEGTIVLFDKREVAFDVKAAASSNFVDDSGQTSVKRDNPEPSTKNVSSSATPIFRNNSVIAARPPPSRLMISACRFWLTLFTT